MSSSAPVLPGRHRLSLGSPRCRRRTGLGTRKHSRFSRLGPQCRDATPVCCRTRFDQAGAGRRGVYSKFAARLAGAGIIQEQRVALARSGAGWEKLKRDGEIGRGVGIPGIAEWSPEEAVRHVPLLKEAQFDGALWCASDGVVDIHALLSGYLKFAASQGTRFTTTRQCARCALDRARISSWKPPPMGS